MKSIHKGVVTKLSRRNSSGKFSIIRLITRKRWYKLRRVLEITDPDTLTSEYNEYIHHQSITNSAHKYEHYPSIVHFVCEFNPPLFIVEALVDADPESVFVPDKKRWYPLHVSCNHGASIDVINYLLYKNTDAVREIDTSGKTALHIVFEQGHRKNVFEMVHVVRLIANVYLSGEGMDSRSTELTPSEFAVLKRTYDVFINMMNIAIKKEKERLDQDLMLSRRLPLSRF